MQCAGSHRPVRRDGLRRRERHGRHPAATAGSGGAFRTRPSPLFRRFEGVACRRSRLSRRTGNQLIRCPLRRLVGIARQRGRHASPLAIRRRTLAARNAHLRQTRKSCRHRRRPACRHARRRRQPLKAKIEADAEGLAALSDKGPDGPVAVSFERDARILRYDVENSLDAVPTAIPAPEDIKTLDFNSGLEGLTRISPQMLFAVAETPQVRGNDHPAWLIPIPVREGNAHSEHLSVKHHDPYEISDAAISPDGHSLYLLERHYFGPIRGVVVAVRRVDIASIKPGARLDGEEIARIHHAREYRQHGGAGAAPRCQTAKRCSI